MPEPAHDALEALRARLTETRVEAERLADAFAAARSGRDDGADGGAPTADGDASGRPTTTDLQALVALLEALRDIVPPDLQRQLAEVTRQILLLLRALIDVWVERLEPAAPAATPVAPPGGPAPAGPGLEDIPVT